MNFSRKASFQVSYATSTFGNFITAPARCDNDQSNICVEQDIVYFISGEAQKRNFWGKWVDETFASSWLMPQLSWHYYYGYAMLATQNGGALCSSLIFNGTKTDIGDLYILNQNNAYWWGGQNTNLVITSVKLDRNLRPNGSFLVPANVIAIPPGYSSLQAYFTTPVNISSMVAGVKCDGYSLGMVTH